MDACVSVTPPLFVSGVVDSFEASRALSAAVGDQSGWREDSFLAVRVTRAYR